MDFGSYSGGLALSVFAVLLSFFGISGYTEINFICAYEL